MQLADAARGPLFVVMNAGSGHGDAAEARAVMREIFRAGGREHEFLLVDRPGELAQQAAHAVEKARNAGGVVVGAGGDGTLSTVAQATYGRGVPFGVLPQGTFNLFGRTHGIPQDTAAQSKALLEATPTEVQAGLVNDELFLVNASLGLYPQLLEDREQWKKRYGRSRAVALVAGLASLTHQRKQLRLCIDDGSERRELKTPTLFVGNNKLQLERIGLHEASDLERGRLAGLVVKPIRTRAMFGLALRGALGRLGDAENIHAFSFRRIEVEPRGKQRLKIALDGEVRTLRGSLTFRVAPEPLLLMMPPAELRAEIA